MGATVSGHWDVNNLNQNIVTNASGMAGFANFKTKNSQTYNFCVTDVVKAGMTYVPSANVETCDTITG